MAGKRKQTDEDQLEAVDLISLLTPPGCDGCYEVEISSDYYSALAEAEASSANEPETAEDRSAQLLKKALSSPSINLSPRLPEIKQVATEPPAVVNVEKQKTLLQRLSPLPDLADDSFERITSEISACEKCDLCKTRHKTVPGVGPHNARLVLIGEAPGADEDSSGIPFIGKAGQHLDKILKAAGFKRDEIFICNILKCRPPGNRNPALSEMICCTPYLQRQLRILQPKLIGCLGNVAIKFVIGPDAPGITRIHGQWFNSIFNIPTMAMYHPSYLIRDESREKGSPNWQMWQDIQTLKKRYEQL